MSADSGKPDAGEWAESRQWRGPDGKLYDHNPLCQMSNDPKEQCTGVCGYCLEYPQEELRAESCGRGK